MLKFHIIIIKFSIFTNKYSQSDTFFPKLKNTIVKIDIKSFSVYCRLNRKFLKSCFTLSFILKHDFPKVAFFKLCGMTSSRNIDRI